MTLLVGASLHFRDVMNNTMRQEAWYSAINSFFTSQPCFLVLGRAGMCTQVAVIRIASFAAFTLPRLKPHVEPPS